jgi:hypothetical protein
MVPGPHSSRAGMARARTYDFRAARSRPTRTHACGRRAMGASCPCARSRARRPGASRRSLRSTRTPSPSGSAVRGPRRTIASLLELPDRPARTTTSARPFAGEKSCLPSGPAPRTAIGTWSWTHSGTAARSKQHVAARRESEGARAPARGAGARRAGAVAIRVRVSPPPPVSAPAAVTRPAAPPPRAPGRAPTGAAAAGWIAALSGGLGRSPGEDRRGGPGLLERRFPR